MALLRQAEPDDVQGSVAEHSGATTVVVVIIVVLGRPVIVTASTTNALTGFAVRAQGIRRIYKDDSAWLFCTSTQQVFVDWHVASSDSDLRLRVGRRGRETVPREFTLDQRAHLGGGCTTDHWKDRFASPEHTAAITAAFDAYRKTTPTGSHL